MRLIVTLSLLLCLISLNGCARTVIHPISGDDIYDGKKPGDKCFSSYYLSNIMGVLIEQSK